VHYRVGAWVPRTTWELGAQEISFGIGHHETVLADVAEPQVLLHLSERVDWEHSRELVPCDDQKEE